MAAIASGGKPTAASHNAGSKNSKVHPTAGRGDREAVLQKHARTYDYDPSSPDRARQALNDSSDEDNSDANSDVNDHNHRDYEGSSQVDDEDKSSVESEDNRYKQHTPGRKHSGVPGLI